MAGIKFCTVYHAHTSWKNQFMVAFLCHAFSFLLSILHTTHFMSDNVSNGTSVTYDSISSINGVTTWLTWSGLEVSSTLYICHCCHTESIQGWICLKSHFSILILCKSQVEWQLLIYFHKHLIFYTSLYTKFSCHYVLFITFLVFIFCLLNLISLYYCKKGYKK